MSKYNALLVAVICFCTRITLQLYVTTHKNVKHYIDQTTSTWGALVMLTLGPSQFLHRERELYGTCKRCATLIEAKATKQFQIAH